MGALQAFFSTPQRQALGWTLLGILGILMATGGVWFLTGDDGDNRAEAGAITTPTATPSATATTAATRTATRTASPTASPTLSPTASPTATAGARASNNPGVGGGGAGTDPATATPVPEPTTPPVVAGGDYCPPASVGPGSGSLPSGRVAGAVTVSGVNAPADTIEIFLAFDGVLGPSTMNIDGGFRIDFYANTSECANRVGASISAYANGLFFPTSRSVGDGGGQLIPVAIAFP